jgi:hypothetical protein
LAPSHTYNLSTFAQLVWQWILLKVEIALIAQFNKYAWFWCRSLPSGE